MCWYLKPLYRLKCCSIILLLVSILSKAQNKGQWGDHGDGTYMNPILPGDFQNTDVIRVGSTYYCISATKELSPGMMIMSSKDLVNWKYLGHAVSDITQINPRYNYDHMQGTSRGIWAGAIRYHQKRFYIYFTDPDEGVFMTSASKPQGPWKSLTLLLKAPGWDDPCPFWDDNGQAYLITTNFSDNYTIHLFKMSPDGERLLTDTDTIIHKSNGSEANKLYKVNNYYYHFYSEVTSQGRQPFMARAKNIYGPYEERQLLIHQAEGEPNQGGMIQTNKGDWYFITHHGKAYWDGREVSLLPIAWTNGWPVWGKPDAEGAGTMVWSAKKPIRGSRKKSVQQNDEFKSKVISPQWEWYFQPRDEKWSLIDRPGFLRLYACKPILPGTITKTTNVLTQRPLRTDQSVVTIKLDIANMSDGQVAGLCLFGKTSGTIGIQQKGNIRSFYSNLDRKITEGLTVERALHTVWLRSSWNVSGESHFFYSTNGTQFLPLGGSYQIVNFGNFLGAKLGIYTANEKEDNGYIDVDWFHYDRN